MEQPAYRVRVMHSGVSEVVRTGPRRAVQKGSSVRDCPSMCNVGSLRWAPQLALYAAWPPMQTNGVIVVDNGSPWIPHRCSRPALGQRRPPIPRRPHRLGLRRRRRVVAHGRPRLRPRRQLGTARRWLVRGPAGGGSEPTSGSKSGPGHGIGRWGRSRRRWPSPAPTATAQRTPGPPAKTRRWNLRWSMYSSRVTTVSGAPGGPGSTGRRAAPVGPGAGRTRARRLPGPPRPTRAAPPAAPSAGR